jgi:hypothetical protein
MVEVGVEAVAGVRRSGAKPTLAPRLVLPGRFTDPAIGGAGRQNPAQGEPVGAQRSASTAQPQHGFNSSGLSNFFTFFSPTTGKPLIGLSGTKHALAMVDAKPTKEIL